MKKETGIYVPLITPFTSEGEVDYAGLYRATKHVLKQNVDGIYAVGGTSEFCTLSTEERKKCLETIISAADGAKVIAHVGAPSLREALELARHAESAGADMLSAVAPYYFGYSFAKIKEYFTAIAHETKLELMIYSASQSIQYSMADFSSLLEDEKITAIKYTGSDFYKLERLVLAFPNKKFYSGMDEAFLSAQIVGATGAIGTTFNYYGSYYAECKRLLAEGKNTEALEIAHKLNAMTEALISVGNTLGGTKYVMTLQGLDILTDCRTSFPAIDEERREKLKKQFVENNL